MKTQINFSPKLGIFQVNFTLNSWEIPNRSFSLNKDCSLNRLLVDGEESSIIPKRMGNLEVYDLPMGHRYELQYQLRLPMEKQWFFIEDDGVVFPLFGEDQPRIRETEVILPDDYVVLSSHELLKVQHHNKLLRFRFSGSTPPVFSIAKYLGDRIFSGEIYLLKKASNLELLSRMLREGHDYLTRHLGSGVFPQPLRYVVLPSGEKPFLYGGTIFFVWPEEEKGLRGFEEVLRSYIGLGWGVDADEKPEFLIEGLNLYFTGRVLKLLYSNQEYEAFLEEAQERKDLIAGKPLEQLVGRDLALSSWLLLEELEDFLGQEQMDQIMKIFLERHRQRRTDLHHFYDTFSSLAWKEGVKAFLEERLYGKKDNQSSSF